MLSTDDSRIARSFKQRVERITDIKRLIVFGSRARGDANFESDFDIFLELPNLNQTLHKQILEIAWETSLEFGVVISPILTSTPALIGGPLSANPLLKTIESEGVEIYLAS